MPHASRNGGNCKNLFETVKTAVNVREAAQLYGVAVNRCGMALCPFHNDRHPSLLVADDHYHCFACGAHGDVIDLAANLFGLSLYDAARKLAADFHLAPDKPLPESICQKLKQKTKAQQLREDERLCCSVLGQYRRTLEEWKLQYAPQTPEETLNERFVEACHRLPWAEYLLDALLQGDSHERETIVQQLMADGSIQKINRQLKEWRKETTHNAQKLCCAAQSRRLARLV